jgi:OmpA-OmpF porin, OOP family
MRGLILVVVAISAAGCSLITVKQDPFPPLEIRADRPPPPPRPPPQTRVVLTASSIVIREKVQFESSKAEILSASFGLLDDVAKVFVENPQIELVQVEGHTDSVGKPDYNKRLSQQRAESVVKYLVGKGVKSERLVAKGFGADRPIADNATDAGKEENRRVEFNIVKQGPKKTVVTE